MWTRTPLSERLGIEVPILQGPFGGGYSTVALAAAVSNAGGLGGFGAVGLAPDEIRAITQAIAERTARPFAINLWVPIAGEDDRQTTREAYARSLARLRPYFDQLGLTPPEMPAQVVPAFEAQAEALLAARPPVFSFVMGIPDETILREARTRGIRTIGTATTVDEAVAIADAGADAVVASGSDAGGHRGSFLRPAEASLVGTMSLVPQIASAVSIPVIAAGGVADGRGIAAALALGAAGVQIGTAFLRSPEAGASDAHKRLLGQPDARRTRLTRAYSGRPARGIENEFITQMAAHDQDVLAYPMQGWITAAFRKAAASAGRTDLMGMWAGQNAGSTRELPAAELVRTLIEETDRVLEDERLRPRAGRQMLT